MRWAGHVGAGLLGYVVLCFVTALMGKGGVAVAGAFATGILTLLPNADRYLPLGHRRGVTHTIWFALNVGIVVAGFAGSWANHAGVIATIAGSIFGFIVGFGAIVTHIAADALVPPGVEPFWPLNTWRLLFAVEVAGTPVGNYGLLTVGCGSTLLALWLGSSIGV